MSQFTASKTILAALVFSLAPAAGYPEGCNAHITPDGAFRAEDGRPRSMSGVEVDDWQMNADIAARLIADFEASGKPILYDYEHNSLYGDTRAAGWIVKLVYVAGRGLFGQVEWTPTGAKDVAEKNYRYSSPLFYFDPKTGAVMALVSVALTNDPALGDLGAVDLVRRAALAALPLGALANTYMHAGGLPGNQHGESDMTPEQLAALTAERDTLKTLLATLTTERDTLKSQVAALTAEKAAAAEAADAKAKADLIAEACAGDKPRLMPAQKAWAEKQSLAALTEYLAATAPLPVGLQSDAHKPDEGGASLSADQITWCNKMGVTPEQYKEAQKSQG